MENIFKKISVESQERIQERTRKYSTVRPVQKPDQAAFRVRRNAISLKKSSLPGPGTHPKTLSHVITWFKDFEVPKGVGRELDGTISLWFHGMIKSFDG